MILMTLLYTALTTISQSTAPDVTTHDTNSRIIATAQTPSTAKCVSVEGYLAYVGYRGGLAVYDIADPAEPRLISDMNTCGSYIHEIRVIGDRAYAAAGFDGVLVLDLANPAQPEIIASRGELVEIMGVDVHGQMLYASGNAAGLATMMIGEDDTLTLMGRRRLTVGG